MKRLSHGVRLTLFYVAIFLIAEGVFGTGMWLVLRVKLFDIADAALQGQAANMQRFLQAHANLNETQLRTEINQRYKINRSEDYIQMSDASGGSIYRSQFLEEHPLPPLSLEDLDRPLYQNYKLGNERFRFISDPIKVTGHVFVVRIGHPMREESDALADFRRYLIWFIPFPLLLASAAGYWLSRRSLPD
jgi:hypothetical protein